MLAIVAPGQGAQTPGFLSPWLTEPSFADRLEWLSAVSGMDLRHYGTEAAGIYNLGGGDRRLLRRLLPPHPAIEAEVLHAVRRELAQTVEDVLVRRLHLYYEHPERGIPAAYRVAQLMAREHAWDERRVAEEAERYEAFARR